ncbi:MAG: Gfo/Idh/MocA family oxidoreductase [Lentisphaeria bacterium]|nr:Gfo/Idh/MocA family oxidoreductase [Lentisphaeria bacterium]
MKHIGVIGYGRRIDHVLKNVLKLAPEDIQIDAFYDISDKAVSRVTSENPKIRVCDSVDELVGIEELDWIFIGSFNACHRDHAIAALDAGKHVFCEKPIATTKDQCLDMLKARRRNPDKEFVVGFVLRYSAFYRTMKQWIDEGRLGDLISMEFNETLAPFHGAAMQGNWRRHTKWGGPMIVEKCCHDMDIMHWLTGSLPARVASFGGLSFFKKENAAYNDLYPVGKEGYKYYDRGLATGFAVGEEENITPFSDDKDTIDNQVAIMELENGARVSFHFCMHSPQLERRFYMAGTRGSIRADVLTGRIEYTPAGWDPKTESVRPIEGDDHGGAEIPMAQDIVDCMLRGKPMPTTLEDGIRASLTSLGLEEARTAGSVLDMTAYRDSVLG